MRVTCILMLLSSWQQLIMAATYQKIKTRTSPPPSQQRQSRRPPPYKAPPNMHRGFRPNDKYCTLNFDAAPGSRVRPRRPAEFFLVSDGLHNHSWDGLQATDGLQLFMEPRLKLMLLYVHNAANTGHNINHTMNKVGSSVTDQLEIEVDATSSNFTFTSASPPWSFYLFATLEPGDGLNEKETKKLLTEQPRIQMLQTSAECIVKGDAASSCQMWDKCALLYHEELQDILFSCGSEVESPVPLALDVPHCSPNLPSEISNSPTQSSIKFNLKKRIGKECTWYLNRWTVPTPDDDANALDSEAALLLGKALCIEQLMINADKDWKPVSFWLKFAMARFLSASRMIEGATSILVELVRDVERYSGWDTEDGLTPSQVQWDILCDALAICAQSSNLEKNRLALDIIKRFRTEKKFKQNARQYNRYLTNLEAILAVKVADLATAARATDTLFRAAPVERYAEKLVLAFMAVSIRRYALNSKTVFQDVLNPIVPDEAGMVKLNMLVDDVERFYQTKLNDCNLTYKGFEIPSTLQETSQRRTTVVSTKTTNATILTDVPRSTWSPTRLDHIPTHEEFKDYYQRREPFIVSLPTQSPSRSHTPSALSIKESLSLFDQTRRDQCHANLQPWNWERSCDWNTEFLCELGATQTVALAVPSTGPEGSTSFAGTARPVRHDVNFCKFIKALDANNYEHQPQDIDIDAGYWANKSHLSIDESASLMTQLSKCYFDAGSPRIEKEDIRLFPLNKMEQETQIPPFARDMAERFSSITMWMGHSTKDQQQSVYDNYKSSSNSSNSAEYALHRSMPGKSGLHYDNMDNIHAVIRGRKRWRIFSPNDAKNLEYVIPPDAIAEDGFHDAQPRPDEFRFYGFETRFSQIGSITEGVDATLFPRIFNATQSVFFVDEGEMLYLPTGFAHEVESEGFSISYTFWFSSPEKWARDHAHDSEAGQ